MEVEEVVVVEKPHANEEGFLAGKREGNVEVTAAAPAWNRRERPGSEGGVSLGR